MACPATPTRSTIRSRRATLSSTASRGGASTAANIAGVPATGRSIELRGINMFRVKDGRVVEQWAELDMLGLLQQIGAIPA